MISISEIGYKPNHSFVLNYLGLSWFEAYAGRVIYKLPDGKFFCSFWYAADLVHKTSVELDKNKIERLAEKLLDMSVLNYEVSGRISECVTVFQSHSNGGSKHYIIVSHNLQFLKELLDDNKPAGQINKHRPGYNNTFLAEGANPINDF